MRSRAGQIALSILILAGFRAHEARAEGEWDIPKDPLNFHLFIFLGQSNMMATGGAPTYQSRKKKLVHPSAVCKEIPGGTWRSGGKSGAGYQRLWRKGYRQFHERRPIPPFRPGSARLKEAGDVQRNYLAPGRSGHDQSVPLYYL